MGLSCSHCTPSTGSFENIQRNTPLNQSAAPGTQKWSNAHLALTKCMGFFSGKKWTWQLKLTRVSKMWIITTTYTVFTIAMIVAIWTFRALIAGNWYGCKWYYFPNPGIPSTRRGTENVIILSLRWPPQPRTFIGWQNVWMHEDPWANFTAIFYFCPSHWRAKLFAIIFVLLNIPGISVISFTLFVQLLIKLSVNVLAE